MVEVVSRGARFEGRGGINCVIRKSSDGRKGSIQEKGETGFAMTRRVKGKNNHDGRGRTRGRGKLTIICERIQIHGKP